MGYGILFFIGLIPWAMISNHFCRILGIDKVTMGVIGTVLLFIQITSLILWAISYMREIKQHRAQVDKMLKQMEDLLQYRDKVNDALDTFMEKIGEPKD